MTTSQDLGRRYARTSRRLTNERTIQDAFWQAIAEWPEIEVERYEFAVAFRDERTTMGWRQ